MDALPTAKIGHGSIVSHLFFNSHTILQIRRGNEEIWGCLEQGAGGFSSDHHFSIALMERKGKRGGCQQQVV